jgi:predicted transcriptional regulator
MTHITVNGVRIEGATVAGQPVTDEQIWEWAAEAERGYDVSRLKPRGRPLMGNRPAKVTTIRLEPTLDAALDERAESYACQGVAIDQDAALEELCRHRARLWAEAEAGEVP